MDIQLSIKTLIKEIDRLEASITTDTANLRECKKALKSFEKIEEQAKGVKMPVLAETEKKP